MTMFIAFGVTFEVPVAVVVLARLGMVSVQQLKDWRPYFLVAATAVSGIVTPPDPTSMIALLIPMYMLYEVGILAAGLFIRHTQAPEDSTDAAKS
jgi:sec-independent protein translocase protein TatC